MFWHYKSESGKERHEEEDNEGVAQCDEESLNEVFAQCALVLGGWPQVGVSAERVVTKDKEDDTSEELEKVHRPRLLDEFQDKAHAQSRDEGVDDITEGGA